MPRPNSLEAQLAPEVLIEIARCYFGRLKTNRQIAKDANVHRQAIPRLAQAGKRLKETDGPQPSS